MADFRDSLRGDGLAKVQRALAVSEEEPQRLNRERSRFSHSSPLYTSVLSGTKTRSKSPGSPDEEQLRRQGQQVLLAREREREASRPYHQFIYQISKERERIQEESTTTGGANVITADINTRAYESVKTTWTERGIWNSRWGILPGMVWKHEEPPEKESAGFPIVFSADPAGNNNPKADEAPPSEMSKDPPRRASGRDGGNPIECGTCIRNPSPAELNHELGPGNITNSQQAPSIDDDSGIFKNFDNERSLSALNSTHLSSSTRVLHSRTRQNLRISKIESSNEIGQPESASLRPTKLSKVSQAAPKGMSSPQQRLELPQNANNTGLWSSSDVYAAEEPTFGRLTPRRSKRIEVPGHVVENHTGRTASTNPSKRAAQLKSEHKAVGTPKTRGSEKPQGISKKQSAKITRGKAGK